MQDTFRLDVILRLECQESMEADDELDALSDYIGERLSQGVSMGLIMQSLAETLVGLDEMVAESITETLH